MQAPFGLLHDRPVRNARASQPVAMDRRSVRNAPAPLGDMLRRKAFSETLSGMARGSETIVSEMLASVERFYPTKPTTKIQPVARGRNDLRGTIHRRATFRPSDGHLNAATSG